MNRVRGFFLNDTVALVIGATLVNLALIYGAGLDLGWWGWSFWAGIGLMIGAVRS